jgi:hypothetical protein
MEKQPDWPGPKPRTEQELMHRIRQRNALCTCDECDPRRYGHCTAQYLIIHLPKYQTRSCVGGPAELRAGQKVEEMELARAAIQYFSRPEVDMDFRQRTTLEEFRYLQCRSLQRFGWSDGPRAVGKTQVLEMLSIYNRCSSSAPSRSTSYGTILQVLTHLVVTESKAGL